MSATDDTESPDTAAANMEWDALRQQLDDADPNQRPPEPIPAAPATEQMAVTPLDPRQSSIYQAVDAEYVDASSATRIPLTRSWRSKMALRWYRLDLVVDEPMILFLGGALVAVGAYVVYSTMTAPPFGLLIFAGVALLFALVHLIARLRMQKVIERRNHVEAQDSLIRQALELWLAEARLMDQLLAANEGYFRGMHVATRLERLMAAMRFYNRLVRYPRSTVTEYLQQKEVAERQANDVLYRR